MMLQQEIKRGSYDNNVGTRTVEEHFNAIIENNTPINSVPMELTPKDLPEWFDEALFKKGENYYRRNIFSILACYGLAVVVTLTVPSILQVLIYTRKSGNCCMAFKRYMETIVHIHNLSTEDITNANSNWYKSLHTVRWKHSTSSERSTNAGVGAITQRDMVFTQYAFVAYPLLFPSFFGLTNEPEGRKAFNHFWRVTGHMLGVDERLNLCRVDESETTELCKKILAEIMSKYFESNPPKFLEMASHALNGLWHFNLMVNKDAFLYVAFKIHGAEYPNRLGWYAMFMLYYSQFILYMFGVPLIGPIVREGFNYYVQINYWIQRRYPIIAWMSFGRENCKIDLYPKLK